MRREVSRMDVDVGFGRRVERPAEADSQNPGVVGGVFISLHSQNAPNTVGTKSLHYHPRQLVQPVRFAHII